jgi:putative ABC transport system permease protein
MILTNLRAFLKFLGRNKVYTAVTIAGFGLSLMFVIVLGLYVKLELSADNFHEKGDRIFLFGVSRERPHFGTPASPWLAERHPGVESFTRVTSAELTLGSPDKDKIVASGLYADSTFFNIFSFPLLRGDASRVLADKNSIVLSQSFAAKYFGEQQPVGQTITVEDRHYTVSGIMADIPENSHFPETDFVMGYANMTYAYDEEILSNWNWDQFSHYFLLREGTDTGALAAAMRDDLKALIGNRGWREGYFDRTSLIPVRDIYLGGIGTQSSHFGFKTNTRTLISIYMAIAILVMLIAVLNYINMTVAQSAFRGREVALKKLHGATRGGVIVQLLVESLTMTIISFAVGLALAFVAEPFFNDVLNTRLGLAEAFSLPVVAVMVGLIVVLAVVSGVVPAMMMSRFKPVEIIKGGFSRRTKGIYSKVFVVFQYAICIVLLVCSVAMIRQSKYMMNYDPGYITDRVFTINNVLDKETTDAFRARVEQMPEVEKAGYSDFQLMSSYSYYPEKIDGNDIGFFQYSAAADFFDVMGIGVTPTGVSVPEGTPAYWINQTGLDTFKKEGETVAQAVARAPFPIIGITADFHNQPLQYVLGPVKIERMNPDAYPSIIDIRIAEGTDLFAVADAISKIYTGMAAGEPFEANFYDTIVQRRYEGSAKMTALITAFAALAMVILVMGVFAMSLYLMRQKEKEIAIRKVSGATVSQILVLLNRQSGVLVLLAAVVAIPVAWVAINRWLSNFAYKIEPGWLLYTVAVLAVLVLSLATVSIKSLQYARRNPVKSLKAE